MSFPALMQAQKISRKAAAAGFEWDTLADVWDQVESEIDELNEAYGQAPKAANGKVEGDPEAMARVEEELGDVLFSMVNVARRMGVNARTRCGQAAASSAGAGLLWSRWRLSRAFALKT